MIKALLLDKDGTILDIERTWIPVARQVARQLIEDFAPGLEAEGLLSAIGIEKDQVCPAGSMASGTNADIARDMLDHLAKKGYPVDAQAFGRRSEALFTGLGKKATMVAASPDLRGLLGRLVDRGFILGLATSDTLESARSGLRDLGVLSLFSYLGADDGRLPAKPDPALMVDFCQKEGLRADQVAMVGDTRSDMIFARQAGAGLALAIEKRPGDLAALADHVLVSIDQLIDEKGKMIWE